MAFDNVIFRRTFKDDYGVDYTLLFTPGGTSNLSSPKTVDLPFGALIKDDSIILKSSYKDDIPLGLEQARTMELSVDINSLVGTYVGDATYNYTDVQKILITGCSAGKESYTKAGLVWNYNIPNRWKLLKGTQVIFDGFQDATPDYEIEIDVRNNIVPIKIICTDIATCILKKLHPYQIEDELNDIATTDNTSHALLTYTSTFGKIFAGKWSADLLYKFHTLQNLYTAVNLVMQDLTEIFIRASHPQTFYISNPRESNGIVNGLTATSGSNTLTTIDTYTDGFLVGETISILDEPTTYTIIEVGSDYIKISDNISGTSGAKSWVCSGLQTPQGSGLYSKYLDTDLTYAKNGNLLPTSMYIMSSIENKGTLIGGCLNKMYKNNVNDFPSFYDFFHEELKANGIKGVIKFGTSILGGTLTFLYNIALYKMLDETTSNSILKSKLIDGKVVYRMNANYARNVTTFVKENNVTGQQEWEYSDTNGFGGDNTIELKPFFTNHSVPIADNKAVDLTGYNIALNQYDSFQSMLYFVNGGKFFKIHHNVKYNIGRNKIVIDYVGTDIPDETNTKSIAYNILTWLKDEKALQHPYSMAKLLGEIFTKRGTTIIELTANSNYFTVLDCGDNSDFTGSEFNYKNIDIDIFGDKCILTNIEQDVLKAETKIKAFIYE